MTDIPSPEVDQPLAKERGISKGPELRLEEKGFATSEVDQSLVKEKVKDLASDRRLRVWMAFVLVIVFAAWNGIVIYIVHIAAETDVQMIREKLIEPAYRTVTDKVYMSLIAATAVQVGTLLVMMTRYLFRAPEANHLRSKSRQ